MQVGNQPTQDVSIDLASQFSAVDDHQLKQKQKRSKPTNGKDGHAKLGDGTKNNKALLPLGTLQCDKHKWERGQIRSIDEPSKTKPSNYARIPEEPQNSKSLCGEGWRATRSNINHNPKGCRWTRSEARGTLRAHALQQSHAKDFGDKVKYLTRDTAIGKQRMLENQREKEDE